MCYNFFGYGEIPKRLKGLVSKTGRGRKSREGSNPSFSAIANLEVSHQSETFFISNTLPHLNWLYNLMLLDKEYLILMALP